MFHGLTGTGKSKTASQLLQLEGEEVFPSGRGKVIHWRPYITLLTVFPQYQSVTSKVLVKSKIVGNIEFTCIDTPGMDDTGGPEIRVSSIAALANKLILSLEKELDEFRAVHVGRTT